LGGRKRETWKKLERESDKCYKYCDEEKDKKKMR